MLRETLFRTDEPDYDREWVAAHPLDALRELSQILRSVAPDWCASDDRIGRGLQEILSSEDSLLPHLFTNPSIDLAERIFAVRGIEALYRDFFTKTCRPTIKTIGASGTTCEYVCYMLCEMLPLTSESEPELVDAYVEAMKKTLELQNESCVEGALHGLGHLVRSRPELGDFIRTAIKPDWSVTIRTYAESCATGFIQ